MDHEYPGSTIYYHTIAKEDENHSIHYITPLDLEDVVETMRMMDLNDGD